MKSISELIDAVQTLAVEDAFRPRINAEAWRVLATYLTRHEVRGGDLLIRQGTHERTMYLLEQGMLQVFVSEPTPRAHRLAILRAGSLVGEAGLLGEGPRMANVEAMAPCVVWALSGQRLEEMAARVPQLAFEVVRAAAAVLAVRLRVATENQVPVP